MVSNKTTFLSFFWVIIEKFGYSAISLLSTLYLARLLSPYEFGLIGTVAIFISIPDMMVEAGFGAALVQKKEVNNKDYSTVFVFNAAMSVFLYLSLFFIAPYIADFYENSTYVWIIRILGLKLLINAITLTQRVHLIRELAFKKQAFINTTALSLSVILAIVLAYLDFGVWALVAQTVTYSIFVSFLMYFNVRFIPSLTFSKESFKELFNFGGRIIINSALNTLYEDIFGLIITKKFSTVLTGLFTQANKLVSFPNNIFSSLYENAGFPILSRIHEEKAFKNSLSNINKGIFSLALPLLLIIPFQANNIVTIVLGEKWIESGSILSILSISLLSSLVSRFSNSVLKAKGKGKEILRYGVLKMVIGLVILLITIRIDFYAIIYGIVLTNILFSIFIFNQISKITLYKWKNLFIDFGVLTLVLLLLYSLINVSLSFIHFGSLWIELISFISSALFLTSSYFLLFKRKMIKGILKQFNLRKG